MRTEHDDAMREFVRLQSQVMATLPLRVYQRRSIEPREQELPQCWKHPELQCPGECQYILPSNECIHERQGP